MENMASEVVVEARLYVEKIGFVGDVTYKTPEVKFVRLDMNGSAGAYKLAYGAVEELEASAKLTITNDILWEAAKKLNDAKLTFASALVADKTKGRRDVMIGGFDIIENEAKQGEKQEYELKIFPHYFLKEIDGKEKIEIDKKKNIVKIAGKDLLEDVRKAVGA